LRRFEYFVLNEGWFEAELESLKNGMLIRAWESDGTRVEGVYVVCGTPYLGEDGVNLPVRPHIIDVEDLGLYS
jgi:hypothetical protein